MFGNPKFVLAKQCNIFMEKQIMSMFVHILRAQIATSNIQHYDLEYHK